ncbi:MAG TPA: hypothetical protein VKA09_03485 [Nitrososphaeraceae archaeon]|nr:hypothetical protein [Nitrososphaeraceae archaeon]
MLLQQTAYFSNDQTKTKNGHVSGSLTIDLDIDEGHGQIMVKYMVKTSQAKYETSSLWRIG